MTVGLQIQGSCSAWALSSSGQYECCLRPVLVCTADPCVSVGLIFTGDSLVIVLFVSLSTSGFLLEGLPYSLISGIWQNVILYMSKLWLQPCCDFICEMIDLDSVTFVISFSSEVESPESWGSTLCFLHVLSGAYYMLGECLNEWRCNYSQQCTRTVWMARKDSW